MNEEKLWTTQEVADFLRVKPHYIYDLKARHKIPYRMVGKSTRYFKSEIVEWIKSGQSET